MGLSIGNIVKGTTTDCYTFGMIGEITNIKGTDVEVRISDSKNEKDIGRIIVFTPHELQVLDESVKTTEVCPVIENRKKQIEKENEALRLEPEATKPLDTKLAARYNAGKPPLSMVESSLIEEVAKVLDFGSRKYTKIKEEELKACLMENYVQLVDLSRYTQGGYVGVVMIDYSKNKTLTMQKTKELIVQNGTPTIKSWLESIEKNIMKKEDLESLSGPTKEKNRLLEKEEVEGYLKNMELLLTSGKNILKNKIEDVLFVKKERKNIIQTIVTRPESSEAFYVLSATTALDFLTILSNFLQMQLTTYLESGKNNWKKGLKFNSVIDSMLRHLLAFKDGQDLDPESGLSHLGHIGCNLQFLIYYMKHNKEMDDRDKDVK